MSYYPFAVLQNYGISKPNLTFKTAHATYTMPKYWESYRQQYNRLSKYKRPLGNSSSNAAAIRSLQRKVSGLTPELQQYVKNTDFTFATAFGTQRVDLTGLLAASNDRDVRITGDSWKNKFLKLRWVNKSSVTQNGILRILVIKPKKAGTTFTFNEGYIPDPNKMTVFYDQTFSIDNENLRRCGQATIPLKNVKSTYVGSTPEAGDIQVYFQYQNCNGGTNLNYLLSTSLQLNYTDM